MFVILSAIPAVQSCLVSFLAMFSHAILFSLLPRYLCEVPVVDLGATWNLCVLPSIVALGATWNLCVLPSIVALGATWRHQLSWSWFCCMHVYLVDCIDLCTGMFSVGFFPPSLFFLAVKVFWVCGGFFP